MKIRQKWLGGALATGLAMSVSMVWTPLPAYAQSITPTVPTVTVIQHGLKWTLIQNADQLAYIDQHASSYSTAHLALTSNINMTGYAWTPWAISSGETVNGQGFLLIGVRVTGTGGSVGVFSTNAGTIESLGVSASVTATNSISNAYTFTGGLVGYNTGTVTNSYATGPVTSTVSGNGSSPITGGLVGYNNAGTVTNSYATGPVTSTDSGTGSSPITGGLVGYNNADTVTNSYATGPVTSTDSGTGSNSTTGGLVGYNTGKVADSYATSTVAGSGTDSTGGLVGYNTNTITDSYWDTSTTKQSTGVGNESAAGASGETTTAMKTENTYAGWNFSTVWVISSTTNDGFPTFLPIIPTLVPPTPISGGYWAPQAFSHVTWSTSTPAAEAPATWTLHFLNSSTGFMSQGSAITVKAPPGTAWPTSDSAYTINGQSVASVTVNTSGSVTLGVPTYLAPGATVTVTMTGVTNPPAGVYAASDSGVTMGIAGLTLPAGLPATGWTFTAATA